ncbi:Beta-hexosaminidase [Paenibacillus solanacearum]|uniref:Beta-hexosaminidase n=1 Tax=Paenibacillus solanacearum TaxID=2048548 RepID=A0A916NWS0_9BACL|nr:glycoside hydrolase family 3 N-terminal domain-containing protein [Paenibacillus solanacearum]CAG7619137.1 Beta-hexosaminidase [Paenibacillus solanacearum]
MKGLAAIRDIGKLTLEQKVGQMILCGFEGMEPNDDAGIIRCIREFGIGGVLYRARNVRDTGQTAQLSRALQDEARDCGQLPLWIAAELGGGALARLAEGMALMPGVMALAAAGNKAAAYEAGLVSGRELKALGIQLGMAPALDPSGSPNDLHVGSQGEERVGDYGAPFLRGLQDAGVVAAAGLLPGCLEPGGPGAADTLEQLAASYAQAVEAGAGVLLAPSPEAGPAAAVIGRLRGQLGDEVVIAANCAETSGPGAPLSALEAVEAGADLIVLTGPPAGGLAELQSLVEAVRQGRIGEERIDRSVRRLLALKERRGVLAADEPEAGAATLAALAQVGRLADKEAARRISEASITVVRDEKALLPVSADGSIYVISVETAEHLQAYEAKQAPFTLGRALRQLGCTVTEFLVPVQEVGRLHQELVRSVRYGQQVVVATYNAAQYDASQAELIRGLMTVGKDPIVVAQCSPCDLLAFHGVSTYVAAYESRPLALRSAAKALLGQLEATGRLPVAIGALHPAGCVGG